MTAQTSLSQRKPVTKEDGVVTKEDVTGSGGRENAGEQPEHPFVSPRTSPRAETVESYVDADTSSEGFRTPRGAVEVEKRNTAFENGSCAREGDIEADNEVRAEHSCSKTSSAADDQVDAERIRSHQDPQVEGGSISTRVRMRKQLLPTDFVTVFLPDGSVLREKLAVSRPSSLAVELPEDTTAGGGSTETNNSPSSFSDQHYSKPKQELQVEATASSSSTSGRLCLRNLSAEAACAGLLEISAGTEQRQSPSHLVGGDDISREDDEQVLGLPGSRRADRESSNVKVLTCGSCMSNDIVVRGLGIVSTHCEFRFSTAQDGNEVLTVSLDNGFPGRVTVNGSRVPLFSSEVLQPGDRVVLGYSVFLEVVSSGQLVLQTGEKEDILDRVTQRAQVQSSALTFELQGQLQFPALSTMSSKDSTSSSNVHQNLGPARGLQHITLNYGSNVLSSREQSRGRRTASLDNRADRIREQREMWRARAFSTGRFLSGDKTLQLPDRMRHRIIADRIGGREESRERSFFHLSGSTHGHAQDPSMTLLGTSGTSADSSSCSSSAVDSVVSGSCAGLTLGVPRGPTVRGKFKQARRELW
ncbi:unnamed protein product, partial [Amoebophrya sp. A25]|eukprot:GSA25T00002683001.1